MVGEFFPGQRWLGKSRKVPKVPIPLRFSELTLVANQKKKTHEVSISVLRHSALTWYGSYKEDCGSVAQW